jgi:hypothetical protein
MHHPVERPDALGDLSRLIRLQEDRDPIVGFESGPKESERRLTVDRSQGSDPRYCFVSTT